MNFVEKLQVKYQVTGEKKGWWTKVKSRNPKPKNKKLWESLKKKALNKFGKWSRAASLWMAKEYKKQGGKY